MYNHAPENYKCPICITINDIENEDTMIKQDDIVYRDDIVMAFISSKFVGNNPGHVLVVPIKHYENLYDLPEEEVNRIMKIAKKMAFAVKKVRNCDGVMVMQNNEPASDQHAFHYHLHVFPRFNDDKLHENMSNARVSTPEEREIFSTELKEYLLKSEV